MDVVFKRLEENKKRITKPDFNSQSSITLGQNSNVQVLNKVKKLFNHRIKGK